MTRFAISAVFLVAACTTADVDPQVGGESHFLTCSVTDDCAVGACVCGVCAVTCEQGCAVAQTCLAADDLCAVPLCDAADCQGGCAAGLECVDGACRAPAQFSCGGATQTTALDADHDLLQGVLPASRAPGCQLADAGGPYCEESPGAIYAVASTQKLSVWCFATAATVVAHDGIDLSSLPPNAVVRFGAGEFNPDGDDIDGVRATLIGQGVDQTRVAGPLTVRGNLARLAGLTIEGDLFVAEPANDAVLAGVHVTGDLRIDGNNSALINVVVLGATHIAGRNPTVVGSKFGTRPEIVQTPELCVASQRSGANEVSGVPVCD